MILHLKKSEFKLFFETFYSRICVFAQSYVSDENVAADIAQEVFIKCWDRKNELESDFRMKAFLYKATRNQCLNYLEHQQVEQNYLSQLNSEDFFKEQVIEQETFQLLHNAINGLPTQSKKVIEMSIKGIKNPEIALRLDVSVNTIKTLKKNAYKSLRDSLKDEYLLFNLFLLFD
ncbi:RNA polymerase sigma-70 factor [Prolixibacteraceae bacterium JC049]|nr:RNA polymerase sigma-70 factor [Prolixibacteraceae bacterium JC049]